MKRFHLNIAVSDLDASVAFYSRLFDHDPTVLKGDYAKWMLDDPRINLSLSSSNGQKGINHVGLQAEQEEEFAGIQQGLRAAAGVSATGPIEQPETECCYAKSSKTWVHDPDDVRWEGFITHGELTRYGEGDFPGLSAAEAARCCDDKLSDSCCA